MIWYEILLYGAVTLSIASAAVVTVLAFQFYRQSND